MTACLRWIVLFALLAAGCGRPGAMAPLPSAAPSPAAMGAMPTSAAEAEAIARPFLGRHRQAALASLSASPLTAAGRFGNAMDAGWELGFWVPGEKTHTYLIVRIDHRGRGTLSTGFGELREPPRGLAAEAFPDPAAAIAAAHAAGLAEGSAYELELMALPSGPSLRVTARRGGAQAGHVTLKPGALPRYQAASPSASSR